MKTKFKQKRNTINTISEFYGEKIKNSLKQVLFGLIVISLTGGLIGVNYGFLRPMCPNDTAEDLFICVILAFLLYLAELFVFYMTVFNLISWFIFVHRMRYLPLEYDEIDKNFDGLADYCVYLLNQRYITIGDRVINRFRYPSKMVVLLTASAKNYLKTKCQNELKEEPKIWDKIIDEDIRIFKSIVTDYWAYEYIQKALSDKSIFGEEFHIR